MDPVLPHVYGSTVLLLDILVVPLVLRLVF